MKKLAHVFTGRPTQNLSMILLSFGLMLLPLTISAMDTEEDVVLESWMTVPFGNELYESEILIEKWMTAPFENGFAEFELQMEEWMTTPFEIEFSEFNIQMEGWMTEDWI